MMRLTRRRSLGAALSLAVLATDVARTQPAHADFFGGDLPLLAGILAEAITQVVNLGSMLTQIVMEVNMMKTMLTGLESGSFEGLANFLTTFARSYNQLTSGVNAMSYRMHAIDSEFKQLYPTDTRSVAFEQHAQYYNNWNQEVLSAAQIASRQQTVIETLDDTATKLKDILDQSRSASGEVAQLQLIVQTLGMMHTQLTSIDQTLATTGRVLSDMAATSASGGQLSLSKKANSLSGYTDKGPAVSVPSRLP